VATIKGGALPQAAVASHTNTPAQLQATQPHRQQPATTLEALQLPNTLSRRKQSSQTPANIAANTAASQEN
jgi:hypothetical protein